VIADAIVVGAGPNGLVAANLLADRGWDVLVVEAADHPGGAVATRELIEPGFRNDVCSAFYPLAAASPIIRDLELDRHGLTWVHAPLVLAHPSSNGPTVVLSRDIHETAASLDADHRGDGDAWIALYEEWMRLEPALLGLIFDSFPPIRAVARLVATTRRQLADTLRLLILPVRRLAAERFGGDGAARLLSGLALHSDLAPENTLSGFYGWLLGMLGQRWGFPSPAGGAGELTNALVRRLEARGGQIVCSSPVSEVIIKDGCAVGVRTADRRLQARRAVLADVDAPQLYTQLVPPRHLSTRVHERIHRFHWDHSTIKVDWTLEQPIPWGDSNIRRAGTVHLADSLDELTRTAADLACRAVPKQPFLVMGQQACLDPSRQPARTDCAWAYTHVPINNSPDDVVQRIEQRIEANAPGFRSLIRGRHVLTPSALEAHDRNLVGGALGSGTAQLHQQLIFRPGPGLGRPETSIRRLYLASASAHPGGGVHGACGANAARAAVIHWRLDPRRC
jgi:phytoene dehydrogenase-like protein